ncbi:MAG TPA: cupin domain-containing protein [Candidatus Sulfotelmatobacter sp.]|jgi:oxalate decarboxylase|nr:cupin domain-containing protein [Candidatus Sulfotelmatobacter sp.]
MHDENEKDTLTRRGFLGVSSVALAAAGVLSVDKLAAQQQSDYKQKSDRSASDPGPTNPAIDAANPDSNTPLPTDAGGVQTFKYPFSFAHKRFQEGGWSREVTQRELAVSKTLAGVDMRLTAGGVRELHWHTAAEWAFMLYGTARITCIDAEGKSFVTDVKENELWFFPPGIPHSIQGLAPDGCEFILVFDDGNFSEYETVLLSDWMAHTPPDVVAKNFGVSQKALANMPKKELFIFQTDVPGPLEEDRRVAAGKLGPSPIDFAFRTMQYPPTKRTKSGEVRIIDANNFKISTTSAAIVTVKPGGVRELHWHPNADEWQYFYAGKGRMTVFATGGRARTMDFETGDVGYIQKTLPHYVENTGNTDLKFLEMFKSSYYQDLALSEWLAHTPPELVAAHLHLDRATLDALPREKTVVMPE